MLREIMLQCRIDVGPYDAHEGVAVFAALFVPKTDGMADLMDRVAGAAPLAQRHRLLPAAPPNLGGAACAGLEHHKIGHTRGTTHEAQRRVRRPMRDGVRHPLLVGHGGIDIERHRRIGPPELLAGDTDRFENRAAAAALGVPQIGDASKDDIALEHRQAVNIGVAQRLVVKCRGRNQGSPGDNAGPELAAMNVPMWSCSRHLNLPRY